MNKRALKGFSATPMKKKAFRTLFDSFITHPRS